MEKLKHATAHAQNLAVVLNQAVDRLNDLADAQDLGPLNEALAGIKADLRDIREKQDDQESLQRGMEARLRLLEAQRDVATS